MPGQPPMHIGADTLKQPVLLLFLLLEEADSGAMLIPWHHPLLVMQWNEFQGFNF